MTLKRFIRRRVRCAILGALLLVASLTGTSHAAGRHHHRTGSWVPMLVTAYSWECGATGFTASGQWPDVGGAAAYRPEFPFGTRMTIPGLWSVRINDVGGGIGWNHIDVFMASCAQAIRWGARYERVLVWR